ncbi:heavy metal translocating P-type ATPase [Chitinivorax sp. B]|uniref:heavy metal translocating P-type ATPase n=1 Tax=Chitinivorax sp. B TaxID=2502235 RepID=UPI0024B635CD|nr:heavy metal translocating P-type ATPase [Chitinivorax sp. B]
MSDRHDHSTHQHRHDHDHAVSECPPETLSQTMRYRIAGPVRHDHRHTDGTCCGSHQPAVVPQAEVNGDGRGEWVTLRIQAMDCPTEEGLIRQRLSRMPAVLQLDFNLMQRTLAVRHELADVSDLQAAIADLGMRAEQLSSLRRTALHIAQMDCPTEEALIRQRLQTMSGIQQLQFNLMQRVLTVHHQPDQLEAILVEIKQLGFSATVQQVASQSVPVEVAKPWWPLVISGVAALSAEAVGWLGVTASWVAPALALLAVLTAGLTTYQKGWVALKNRNLNINALMSIAVTGALLIGQWPEAAMVMFLFAVAERIEARSLDRARQAIRGLMQLTPEQALVKQSDDSWIKMSAEHITLGSVVRVAPGERVALDGVIVDGQSTVDQAPITGESLPVEKCMGDTVFGGTINQSGSFDYQVTAAAGNTMLARIIHAVEAAQGARAPTQRFVDQFSRVYTPAVFAIALAVAVLPPLIADGVWFDWVYRALVLLVIACPCALVISTPVTIVSGLAAAAKHGILVKGGGYLEAGRTLTWLALDKTGTLTHGRPAQTDFVAIGEDGVDQYRQWASSLANRSDHPVSQAITRQAAQDKVVPLPVEQFQALPGQGVRGEIAGQLYYLGNHHLVESLNICSPVLEAKLDVLERQGKTVVLLCRPEGVLALFAVADTVKDTSREAIAELHQLGVKTLMLTGDNPHTAAVIGQQVGMDDVRGNQLPIDKQAAIQALCDQRQVVGMVGDGINDAPALAQAHIGFAMGAAGTDTAIETADVALMDDDLRKIPRFIRLSRDTAFILRQNIVLALGIKAVFLGLTIMGQGTMWMAVFADMGASLLVVFNGLRLLRR